MKPTWWMTLAVLAASRMAGAGEPAPVGGKCAANGNPILMVRYDSLIQPPIGDPNGSHQPWCLPGGSTAGCGQAPIEGSPVALPLGDPWQTNWDLRATADFDGDGTCDLAWTRVRPDESGQSLVRVALTVTGVVEALPHFSAPSSDDDGFAQVGSDWTLVGSGDFVGLTDPGDPGPTPPDGRPDLLFFAGNSGELSVWASDGAGHFPAAHRYSLPAGQAGWSPTVVANIDGEGPPEVIWFQRHSARLGYSRIVQGAAALEHQAGGPLVPDQPIDANWTLRAVEDVDRDGRDDLVFQNRDSEKVVVWFMNGIQRRDGAFFRPDRLATPRALAPKPPPEETWTIVGPR